LHEGSEIKAKGMEKERSRRGGMLSPVGRLLTGAMKTGEKSNMKKGKERF